MKYIKVFETTSDYESALSELDRPNVSYIEATGDVEYNDVLSVPTSISFLKFQDSVDGSSLGSFVDYEGEDVLIMTLTDPSNVGTSTLSEMIQIDSVVEDNLGNDITQDCTFTIGGNWYYNEIMCDDGEGNEFVCENGLYNDIGVDDDDTSYTGTITASYTTSGGQTLTSTFNLRWTQTSDGQNPDSDL